MSVLIYGDQHKLVIARMSAITYEDVMIYDTTREYHVPLILWLCTLAGSITYGDSVHTHMMTMSVHIIIICDCARAHFGHHM